LVRLIEVIAGGRISQPVAVETDQIDLAESQAESERDSYRASSRHPDIERPAQVEIDGGSAVGPFSQLYVVHIASRIQLVLLHDWTSRFIQQQSCRREIFSNRPMPGYGARLILSVCYSGGGSSE